MEEWEGLIEEAVVSLFLLLLRWCEQMGARLGFRGMRTCLERVFTGRFG